MIQPEESVWETKGETDKAIGEEGNKVRMRKEREGIVVD